MYLELFQNLFILTMLGFGLIKYLESIKLKKTIASLNNQNVSLNGSLAKLLHRIFYYRKRVAMQETSLGKLNADYFKLKIKHKEIRKENHELKSRLDLLLFCETISAKNEFDIAEENLVDHD